MELDDAYANAAHIPNGMGYPDIWAEKADEYRAVENAIGRARLNQAYGSGAREKFDLFHPAGPAEGVIVFVHGGYWRMFGREDFSHLARGARDAGWQIALPSYTLAPEASIAEITGQIAQAITEIGRITQGPIVLSGHSAGGHLVARMLNEDVELPGSVADRIVRVVPISPVADLRPLLKTSMNADFKLNASSARAESPGLQPKSSLAATHVWVGADERPVFLDQANWLATAWSAPITVEPDRHHFDVIEGLEDASSALMQCLIGAP